MFLSLPPGIWKAGNTKMGNANAERKSLSQWQQCWFCHSGANSWPDSYPQDAALANWKWPKGGYQRNAPARGKFSLGHIILLWLNVQVLPDPTGTLISGRSAAKIQNPCSGCHEIPRVTIHTWALEIVLKKGWRKVRETQNCCIKTDLVFWGPGSHKCNNSLCSVKW